MPTVGMRVYSALFKSTLSYRFDRVNEIPLRMEQKKVSPNPAFVDGVASKDVIINEKSGLCVRMFLPEAAVQVGHVHNYSWMVRNTPGNGSSNKVAADDNAPYKGYVPQKNDNNHRLPVVIQFHSGAFVMGSKDSVANDSFCRRMAKVCSSIVVAVEYRLGPEHKCPAAYDDGYEVLQWLARQATLITNDTAARVGEGSDMGEWREISRGPLHSEVVDTWLDMHADVSRCVLIGVSAGANIADHVARRASTPQSAVDLGEVNVRAQVLLYPLFGGQVPTPSEVKLGSTSLFFDQKTLHLAFRLFLPKNEFSLDHPAINPLIKGECPPGMPPTLTITAEHDMTKDRTIAYNVFLRRLGVEAQNLDYKNVAHGFASMEVLMNSPEAEGCAEDIAIWVHKHISRKGGELSY